MIRRSILASLVTAACAAPAFAAGPGLVLGQPPVAQAPAAPGTPQPPAAPPLTLRAARDMALKNHPRVLSAQSAVAEAGQVVREQRAPYFPTLTGALTGVTASDDQARIGAGSLSASRLISRVGEGVVASQLVTDLGRTQNLVASSQLQAQASQQGYQATREQVLLDVDNTYFGVLRAEGVVRVAQQTVDARQLLFDQVNTLAQNNLRSQLDVSFADVNVADAKLLLIRAQNDLQEAYAQLTRAVGSDTPVTAVLADEPVPSGPPPNAEALVAQAIAERPDVAQLRFSRDAAYKFAYAERDLYRPSVTVGAVAGNIPVLTQVSAQPTPENYAAAVVNVNVPVFNGGLYSARSAAARLRAQEADQNLRDYQERVARDVRVAWANATNAYQRIDVTAQFLRAATLSLDLAQGRYNLGLSSIVELTQSQLNVTRAEIENLSAKYDYQSSYAALQYALGQLR
ncbi:MAG TPA: TolC family protein [Vicinamibacterales bacterium]|nr:TolC family protein [Vicinamibacterales bacterium]